MTSKPPPFLFLSHQRISYPGSLTLRSGIVWSSFDSVIPIIAALVLLAMHFNSSSFWSKLSILIWRKCKPFLLSSSQMLVFLARDIWNGQRFRLKVAKATDKNC